ncbi:MAG TPA: hypothetical protein VGW10_05345 [Solirubrobacteraceae bacterium]|nr:hypothetical protein [Solirubrobacteraceae bacterium]
MRVKAAITVNLPPDEVQRRWQELRGDDEIFGYLGDADPSGIRFEPAPGERGTEIYVDLEESTFGGAVGEKIQRVAGTTPDQQADDDLRRFKQVLETGEVVRSDGSPNGAGPRQHRAQRPAQPLDEPVGAIS